MRPDVPPLRAVRPAGRRLTGVRKTMIAAVACGLAMVGGSFVPANAAPTTNAALTANAALAANAAQQPLVATQLGTSHKITYDQYSFLIDGKRTYLWAGEFHYFRLPSPDLWRDVLTKMKAGGFNAVSLYFDWAYHSAHPGTYDFTGVRDVDKLLDMATQAGIYVIARPGPYINAEVDSGGLPGWMTNEPGRARSNDPGYLKDVDEWLEKIDTILARHQLTNGTGTVLTYQVENEFYKDSTDDRAYMTHLEQKARADGITVPFVGNHNNHYNAGAGAVDVDMPDGYPQGFNCSNPTQWRGVGGVAGGRAAGKPLGIGEFQGGSFDPWGGPGYDKCRQLTGPDFEKVFYKQNIALGATQQSFYMTYGGTSWGWQADPSQVYSSYDYGAPITEGRQLTTKYDEDKRIGYFTQAVAPLTKTDALGAASLTSAAIVDTARINPDDSTQFHVLRHADSTSTATDATQLTLDLGAKAGYTYDDVDAALAYTGAWSHVGAEQSYTGGDYGQTESFSSTAGDAVTVAFTGTGIRWISSKELNHGIADVYLDGAKVATVDGYSATKVNQQVFYAVQSLPNGPHTLKIQVTGTKNPSATGQFVVADAFDVRSASADALLYTVPQKAGTAITFAGRDSKIIVANYQLGAQHLQYSTSEIMTHAQIGDRDVALLYGRDGQDGETVLHYAAQPKVTVLDGSVDSTWDAARGDLRLNYKHSGLARVLITGGTRPLLLLLATDEVATTFWTQATASGPILVRGPYLLAGATDGTGAVNLTGETAKSGDLEVFGKASNVTWNGSPVTTTATTSGSLLGTLPGPKAVALPDITGWKHMAESPEAQPGFDDANWVLANHTTTNVTTNKPLPTTLPVLYADDYGFHYGDVWYRGHLTATGTETGITLSAITGKAGVWSVWLNGTFLGSRNTTDPQTFTFPAGTLHTGGANVISVLVENMGHNEDYNEDDWHKQPRGLTAATLTGTNTGTLSWRIQGAQGGEFLTDPTRGPMNTGGLYGERAGWSKPDFTDTAWSSVTLPRADTTPGVSWYRTNVKLDLPRDQDTSVGLRITDDAKRHYRALIFVNGWQLGRYVNDTGPQHSFPIPNGVLNPNGDNSVALAVWNTDTTSGGLGTVSLESYGSQLVSAGPPASPTPTPTATPTQQTTTSPTPGSGGGGGPGTSSGPHPSASSGAGTAKGGGLAVTGFQVAAAAAAGVGLLIAGVLLTIAGRRRRRAG